jgi:heme exporter protein D
MQWNSISDFIHMGGYGLYVWGSYGVALAVMVAEALLARRRHARAKAHISVGSLEDRS